MPPIPVHPALGASITFSTTADLPFRPRTGHTYTDASGARWYVTSVTTEPGIRLGDPPQGKLYRIEFRGEGPRLPELGTTLVPEEIRWTESLVRIHLPAGIRYNKVEEFVGTPWFRTDSTDPSPFTLLRLQDRQEDGSYEALVGCSRGRVVPARMLLVFDTQTYFQKLAAEDMAGKRHG